MSFLVDHDEEPPLTLEAAFELIEACSMDTDDLSSDPNDKPTPPSTVSSAADEQTLPRAKFVKRPRRRLCASTDRRRKREIQMLRELVEELERQLVQLQRRRKCQLGESMAVEDPEVRQRNLSSGPDSTSSATEKESAFVMWKDLAIIQSRERHRSEILNRNLKAILANQLKFNESLRRKLFEC